MFVLSTETLRHFVYARRTMPTPCDRCICLSTGTARHSHAMGITLAF